MPLLYTEKWKMHPANNLADLAAWLLGRPLTKRDGVPAAECEAAQQRLGCALPAVLKDFYKAVGRQPLVMSSFQRFAEPHEWTLSDGKIVFLEENQGVCYWAVDAQSKVYQAADLDAPQWHPEPLDLAEFLQVLLYYQMAQGGYAFCGMIPGDDFSTLEDVQSLVADMQGRPVVDMSGLKIFVVADQALVWYLHEEGALPDPGLFLSALHEDPFQHWSDKWSFDDLG